MRYHHIEDGAARAMHRAFHYVPEALNTLSTLLLSALGFIDGNTRWLLLAMGVCFLAAGLYLARKRGLRVKMCVWLGVSRGLDLAFLNAD